jgi:hypothetical protein
MFAVAIVLFAIVPSRSLARRLKVLEEKLRDAGTAVPDADAR